LLESVIECYVMKNNLKKIKLILLDVDGVLTDGRIIKGSNGFEILEFHVHDGVGIVLAKKAGYLIGIISGRDSEIIHERGAYLGIDEIHTNVFYKTEPYEKILKKYNLTDQEVCYVGDELLDLPILERVGFSVAPSNAIKDIKQSVDYITKAPGGNGAVREVIDLILEKTGKKKDLIKKILTKKP